VSQDHASCGEQLERGHTTVVYAGNMGILADTRKPDSGLRSTVSTDVAREPRYSNLVSYWLSEGIIPTGEAFYLIGVTQKYHGRERGRSGSSTLASMPVPWIPDLKNDCIPATYMFYNRLTDTSCKSHATDVKHR